MLFADPAVLIIMDNHTRTTPMDAVTPQDNWYGVKDPKERKRIQDRLAQRARRKRLASQRASEKGATAQSSSVIVRRKSKKSMEIATKQDQGGLPATPESFDHTHSEDCLHSVTTNADDLFMIADHDSLGQLEFAAPMSVDTSFFPIACQSAFAALFENGTMLGLTCSTTFPWRSKPVGPHIPLSLHPTPLQLITIHATWIDRFPFPRMRDNLIRYSGVFEEDHFLRDLFSLKSFWVRDGGAGWNPEDWRIGAEMNEKWGYLFQ